MFFHHARWCRPEKSRFTSLVNGSIRLEVWNDLWIGDGNLHPPEVELAQHTNRGQPENRPGGVGISTPCGEVSTQMVSGFFSSCRSCRCVGGFRPRHVTLSCPGDAYFVYESWPMYDQTKITCFFFGYKNSNLKNISVKIASAVVAYCIYKK